MDGAAMVDYANFLSRLGKREKQQLIELGHAKHFMKDEFICSLGRTNEDIYLLMSGRVKLYELTAEGKEVILWFCIPGELFGVPDALIANHFSSRQINAQSCGYAELLCIDHQAFLDFIDNNPSVVLPLIQLLSFRFREVAEVLSDITSSDVTSRVVKLLLRLSGRYGKQVDGGVFLELPITHQEMADMIGASRQTVTTVLGDLKRQGLIHMEQRTMFLRDGAWLEKFLGKMRHFKVPNGKLLNNDAEEPIDISI
jgi:CRP/FNR family transcriptional regulator, cyclic AMP receptor protein